MLPTLKQLGVCQAKEKQEKFFDVLGIQQANVEFWEWFNSQPPSMSELKKAVSI